MNSKILGALALAALAGTASADIALGTPTMVASYQFGTPSFGTRAVTAGATYSDVTSFSGSGYAAGGGAAISGLATSKYVSEEIHMIAAQPGVIQFTFSIANFNATAVTARPRVRFHLLDNGGGTNTGTYITGFSFTPFSIPTGVSLWNGTTAAFALPKDFSMGICFDNSTTTATQAQINKLGVGAFDPPDVGTSPDLAFQTTAASVGNVTGAAGATFNFSGAPVANFGWEIVPAPSSIALIGLGGLMAGRRRR